MSLKELVAAANQVTEQSKCTRKHYIHVHVFVHMEKRCVQSKLSKRWINIYNMYHVDLWSLIHYMYYSPWSH